MGKIIKISFVALLLLGGLPLNAQKVRNDTTYYAKPDGNWHLRLRSDLVGSSLLYMMPYQGDIKGVEASTGARFKQCVGAGWKNLFLNVGFNPFAKAKDLELNVNAYGNMFGFESNLGASDSMAGSYAYGNGSGEVVKDDLNPGDLIMFYGKAKAYYAFNWKRFSFSSAMNQNRIQKRSAGSPLLTAEARWLYMTHIDDQENPDFTKGLVTFLAGAGGGYAYNWVPVKNLLVHASLLANYGFLNNTAILNGKDNYTSVRSNAVFSVSGSTSVVYHFRKWYVGAFASLDNLFSVSSQATGMDDSYVIQYLRGDAHFAVGVRF